jgi:hypothetical protein
LRYWIFAWSVPIMSSLDRDALDRRPPRPTGY